MRNSLALCAAACLFMACSAPPTQTQTAEKTSVTTHQQHQPASSISLSVPGAHIPAPSGGGSVWVKQKASPGAKVGVSVKQEAIQAPKVGVARGGTSVDALKALDGKEFEIAYLSQMIAHHQAAVDMARQALQVATRPETRDEAQKVIDRQTQEIDQMMGWLKAWHNLEPAADQQQRMPVENDQMFYEMMISHHQGAIDRSRLVKDRTEKSELVQLAQDIIVGQTAEMERYRSLM